MKKLLIIVLLFYTGFVSAQELNQTIRGQLLDKQGQFPLMGALVQLGPPHSSFGAATDMNGEFKIENVPVGRVSLKISYLGYQDIYLNNILLTSGKELYLNLEMEESVVKTDEVVIKGKSKDETNNRNIAASGRTFSVEESNRFAGSWGDPSRMASSFAGIQGANDQRNDIIVRGNSPTGILWRLEGVDIPNPNHFGSQGASGGPISILNNNLLANSDFITGAFPATYGNALAGVFDLTMRTGNNQKREFIGQVGFNGLEFLAEGPISKKNRSSYLVSYRYSTLSIFSALGISFGVSGVPQYQDLSFKLNFPSKKLGNISVFGIGGNSEIALLMSERDPEDWTFGSTSSTDIYYKTRMGVLGVSQKKIINKKTYFHLTLAASGSVNDNDVDSVDIDVATKTLNATYPLYNQYSSESKLTGHALLNKKFSSKSNLRLGVIANRFLFNSKDSTFFRYLNLYRVWSDYQGNSNMMQPYIQWQYKFSDLLTLNIGAQQMVYMGNNSTTFEPRLGIKYQFHDKQSIALAYGKHSQIQPLYTYYSIAYDSLFNNLGRTNENLDLTKAHHIVLGYDWNFAPDFRLKAETYFQYVYDVPVESIPTTFSMLNAGADFGIDLRDSMVNTGTGRNYGIELTVEKFFSKGYYFLLTTSLFDSKYIGSNGEEYNTVFNGRYVGNGLFGKEFKIGEKSIIETNIKYVMSGGRRFTPFTAVLGDNGYEAEYDYTRTFAEQHQGYRRFDIKIAFKLMGKKVTQSWAFDVQNIFNRQNILTSSIDPVSGNVQYEYQLGLFPVGQYKIEF